MLIRVLIALSFVMTFHPQAIAQLIDPQGDAWVQRGMVAFNKRDHVEALRCFSTALPFISKTNNEAKLGQINKLIGDVYQARNYYRQAIDHYREALPLLRKTDQLTLLSECLEKMAGIQADFGYIPQAINHYNRALVIKNGMNDAAGALFCHQKLSRLYFSQGSYEDALSHNTELLSISGADAPADALIQRSIILTFMDRCQDAESVQGQASKVIAGHNNPSLVIQWLAAKSNLCLAQKDKIQAQIYLDSAKVLIRGTQSPELAIDALEQMSIIHHKNGDNLEAYEALVLLDRYKDVYRNENIERISAEIKDAAETALKEKEIAFLSLSNRLKATQLEREKLAREALLSQNIFKDSTLSSQSRLLASLQNEAQLKQMQLIQEKKLNNLLQRENQLKQLTINQGRRIRFLLGGGMTVLALLGIVIFGQFRKQQRKNDIIRRQSEELTVLHKEVHHRVKNNLQVISSMLDLQSLTIKDSAAKEVIKESILRVQAMAFIHQNLYLDDASNTVNMQEYFQTLADHLFNAYSIHSSTIQYSLNVGPMRLHTDTAVPLGMIVNELVGNALKYAFPDRQRGHIHIALEMKNQKLLLQVKDDGKGLPDNFDPYQTQSFGYEIIKAFAQKLKAALSIQSNDGTDVQMIISKFK